MPVIPGSAIQCRNTHPSVLQASNHNRATRTVPSPLCSAARTGTARPQMHQLPKNGVGHIGYRTGRASATQMHVMALHRQETRRPANTKCRVPLYQPPLPQFRSFVTYSGLPQQSSCARNCRRFPKHPRSHGQSPRPSAWPIKPSAAQRATRRSVHPRCAGALVSSANGSWESDADKVSTAHILWQSGKEKPLRRVRKLIAVDLDRCVRSRRL